MDKDYQDVANVLNVLFPADAIIHIGAGEGFGPLNFWHNWKLELAIAIDAQDNRLKRLRLKNQNIASFLPISRVVADKEQKVIFYLSSNPDHAGLVASDHLKHLWPNLRDVETFSQEAIILDSFIGNVLSKRLWLVIECFGATDILAGGDEIISYCHVVFSRVIINQNKTKDFHSSSLIAVDEYMNKNGFIRVKTIPCRHPDIADAVYVRDLALDIKVVTKKYEESNLIIQSKEDEIADIKSNHQNCINTIEKKFSDHQELLNELQRDRDVLHEEVTRINSEYKELAKNSQIQIKTLTQDRDSQKNLVNEKQKTIKNLQMELELLKSKFLELENQHLALKSQTENQIVTLTHERDLQNQITLEKQSALETSKQELQLLRDKFSKLKDDYKIFQSNSQDKIASLTKDRDLQKKFALEKQNAAESLNQEYKSLQSRIFELEKEYKLFKDDNSDKIETLTQDRDLQKQIAIEQNDALELSHNELLLLQDKLLQFKDEYKILQDNSQDKIISLTKESDLQKKLVMEKQKTIETLKLEFESLQDRNSELENEYKAFKEDYKDKITALTEDRDLQKQIAIEKQDALNSIQKKLDAYNNINTKLESMTKERDKAMSSLKELQLKSTQDSKLIQDTNEENKDLKSRQQLLNEELLRAEAQIDLIKDILLRESEL